VEGVDIMVIVLSSLVRRTILPPSILAAVATQLEHQDRGVRGAAGHTLRLHRMFYYNLLAALNAGSLNRARPDRASRNSRIGTWMINFCVSIPEQIMDTPIHGQKIDVRAMISEVQPPNMLSICGLAH
jgi:hypothetical protein